MSYSFEQIRAALDAGHAAGVHDITGVDFEAWLGRLSARHMESAAPGQHDDWLLYDDDAMTGHAQWLEDGREAFGELEHLAPLEPFDPLDDDLYAYPFYDLDDEDIDYWVDDQISYGTREDTAAMDRHRGRGAPDHAACSCTPKQHWLDSPEALEALGEISEWSEEFLDNPQALQKIIDGSEHSSHDSYVSFWKDN